jgi:hypothetical protein
VQECPNKKTRALLPTPTSLPEATARQATASPTAAADVNDLFAQLVASGIIREPKEVKKEGTVKTEARVDDSKVIHKVDLLDRDSLRVYVFSYLLLVLRFLQ